MTSKPIANSRARSQERLATPPAGSSNAASSIQVTSLLRSGTIQYGSCFLNVCRRSALSAFDFENVGIWKATGVEAIGCILGASEG